MSAKNRSFSPICHRVRSLALRQRELGMVARLFAPQFLVLYTFFVSVLVVHFRGRERLGFGRQLTDHSTIMAPYNALMYLFSKVPNKPILPVSTVPDLAKLRDRSEER